MDAKKSYKIRNYLITGTFNAAYNAMNIYINDPDDPAKKEQTAINERKKEMLTLAKSAGFYFNDPDFDLLGDPDLEEIKALLTGGNRHTKRTKRTTNRKMRKSLIRRRR
jgi:hypothetical protein